VARLLNDDDDDDGGGGTGARDKWGGGGILAVCDVANNIKGRGMRSAVGRMSDGDDPRTMNAIQQSTKNDRGRLGRSSRGDIWRGSGLGGKGGTMVLGGQ
jgi:hypothetical protein